MRSIDQSYSRDLDLGQLLLGIDNGQVALPNFQRDFDWNEADIASLLATVFSGWPAGSLLVMEGQPAFFDLRKFEGAPTLAPTVQYVVLDGQQRLTSLYHALKGTGKKIWCLSVDRALERDVDAELIEDALVSYDPSKYSSEAVQDRVSNGEILPLHFAGSAADFYDWRDRLLGDLPEDRRSAVSENLTRLYRGIVSTAHSYKFPVMILKNSLEPAAVARIFERINKTGMRLSVFDLLVARSYAKNWNLRDVWITARDEEALLSRFCGDDGLAVIQAIALHRVRDIRRPALLRLDAEVIRTEWERFVEATTRAARFLTGLGVEDASWLPYSTQLIPLAALAAEVDLDQYSAEIERWFWGSSFAAAYAVASSTVAADDFDRLRKVRAGGGVEAYPVSYVSLRQATKQNSGALWRSVRAFLRHSNARDLLSGQPLGSSASAELEMESVVPRIDGHGGDVPYFRSVLSLALVERESIRKMRARPVAMRGEEEINSAVMDTQYFHGVRPADLISDPEGTLLHRFQRMMDPLQSSGAVIVLPHLAEDAT